ncbi:MAG TPA: hypothetical protein VFE50_26010 [Cyclobacteriaceae bacterium]|nr:hypothetical protein [Cyclobacteriaceae bacterium]
MALYKTDWLNSDPVFYNEKTGKVSKNINDVIDFGDFDFDPEGVLNYLEFGFSVLGKTPVRNVRFLEHSSELSITNGKVETKKQPDVMIPLVGQKSNAKDTIEFLRSKVNAWESSFTGEIVIPTSGGYDSRLMNLFIKDKERIRAFTYGISSDQSQSSEVLYAKKISEILKTRWEQIELENFHQYIPDWYSMYGVATHAHGMYHIDFYSKIVKQVNTPTGLLSGIIGDAWSGRVKVTEIKTWRQVQAIAYTHGINLSADNSVLKSNRETLQQYFIENEKKLQDPNWRIIEAMRFKLMLLSYLYRVPAHFGLHAWSPFLDAECAAMMLNLPAEDKADRSWQTKFFKQNNLYVEDMVSKVSNENSLDLTTLARYPLKPLDPKILREVVEVKFVEWVNKNARVPGNPFMQRALNSRYARPLTRPLGLTRSPMEAYNAYMVLWPLQRLIEDRNRKLNPK